MELTKMIVMIFERHRMYGEYNQEERIRHIWGYNPNPNPNAKYIGQTRTTFRTRMSQHANDVTSNKTDETISGISKHARHCNNGTINWTEPKIITTYNDKNKKGLTHNLLIRESLEIRRLGTSSGSGLNDPQLCVKSNAWDPILQKIKDT